MHGKTRPLRDPPVQLLTASSARRCRRDLRQQDFAQRLMGSRLIFITDHLGTKKAPPVGGGKVWEALWFSDFPNSCTTTCVNRAYSTDDRFCVLPIPVSQLAIAAEGPVRLGCRTASR
jgi:hypothetical protein